MNYRNLFKINLSALVSLALFSSALIFTGCASDDHQKRNAGAGIGAGVGALAGAIIGHQSGNREQGALIGAALGGAGGAIIGDRMDKQAKELEKVAETKRTEQGLVTKLKSDILFDSGKSALKGEAKKSLAEMGTIMKKYPENVLVVKGYTDSTGTAATNEKLSLSRAEAVKTHLVASGIPANTITAQGMGPANPIGDNGNAEGRKTNRRVEVEVTADASKVPQK